MSATRHPSGDELAAEPLRSPDEIMTLARMGAGFPHRLSFMRSFIRRVAGEKARMTVPVRALDREGHGHAVLTMPLGGHDYSLIAFSRPLDDADRTDRVIATKWDASFCLFDGVPDDQDIGELADMVTRQEAGRYHQKVLTLSRANKSVRLFGHVVEELARGRQPDAGMVATTGYLMRTTAVYGNGKFGIADRDVIAGRPGLAGPFQAEMLTVYLIREFTFLLVEHIAAQTGKAKATGLDPGIRRHLGIGNSTGLGMAPFLVNHPILLHCWVMARETALARIRGLVEAEAGQLRRFDELMGRAILHCRGWTVEDEVQMGRIERLRAELEGLRDEIAGAPLSATKPFDDAFCRSRELSLEAQEIMVSILVEIAPGLVDGLVDCMASPRRPALDPAMAIGRLKAILAEHYRWVGAVDAGTQDADRHFWYTSEEKLEPRLGDRHGEPGAEREMPFNIALYIRELEADLASADDSDSVATFLMRHPEHRHIVRRAQTTALYPYAEVHDNLVGAECRPVDLLRFKLAFFGASKFDPKSDRWTRITLFQGAPVAAELADGEVERLDDWIFALGPESAGVGNAGIR